MYKYTLIFITCDRRFVYCPFIACMLHFTWKEKTWGWPLICEKLERKCYTLQCVLFLSKNSSKVLKLSVLLRDLNSQKQQDQIFHAHVDVYIYEGWTWSCVSLTNVLFGSSHKLQSSLGACIYKRCIITDNMQGKLNVSITIRQNIKIKHSLIC